MPIDTHTSQNLRRRPLLRAALLVALISGVWLALPGKDTSDIDSGAFENPQRLPIRNPVLEADRPDLLSEPGMEMVEDGNETEPGLDNYSPR